MSGARSVSLLRLQVRDLRAFGAAEATPHSGGPGAVIWTRTEYKCGAKAGVAREHQVVLAPHSDASKSVLLALASYYRAAREHEHSEAYARELLKLPRAKFAILDEAVSVLPEQGEQRALYAAKEHELLFSYLLHRRAGQTKEAYSAIMHRRALAYATMASFAVQAPRLFANR